MKLSAFLILLSVVTVLANETYSQTKALSINMENATVKEVLSKIEDQSEFYFMYSGKMIDADREVSVVIRDQKIETVLNSLFAETDVEYVIEGKYIVLTTPDASDEVSQKALQQTGVSGTVTDQSGEPLPGVTVLEKGTSHGTVTGIDGKYNLSDVSDGATLQFSFIGMISQEIVVGSQSMIDVILEVDAIGLEEVVALGYTTIKKRNVIGSVAKVKTESLTNPAYANLTSALEGKAAGVYVSSRGGIRVRGANSINLAAGPLWIIDGVPGDGAGLNPNDILSLDVLKDAAATALYGSSGANGVIVVTTNALSKTPSQVHVEVSTGYQEHLSKHYPLANTTENLAIHDLGIRNSSKYTGIEPALYDPTQAFIFDNRIPPENYLTREEYEAVNTNVYNEVYEPGTFTQAYITATKAFEDEGKAYISLNYRNEDPMEIGEYSNKVKARFGFNFTPAKNLDVVFMSTASFSNSGKSMISTNFKRPPFMPLYDESDITGYWSPAENPIIRSDLTYSEANGSGGGADGYLKLRYALPVRGLSIGGLAKAAVGTSRSLSWTGQEISVNGEISRAKENFNLNKSFFYQGRVDFVRSFDLHSVSAFAIAESNISLRNVLASEGSHLNGSYHTLGIPGQMVYMESELGEGHNAAFIGRFAYNYNDKYMLEANLRRDGLAKLLPENRWATFPSVGAGWLVSEESFFNVPVINLFKIRGSMGKTGNAGVPTHSYAATYIIGTEANIYNYNNYTVTRIDNIPANIKWETSDNWDIGFDYGLFKNRFNGSFAWYKKEISGLILKVPTPPSTGMPRAGDKVYANVGNMRNTGYEFDMMAKAVNRADFDWDISFNMAFNHNEILALEPSVDQVGSGIYGAGLRTLTKKGDKLASFYLAEFAGIDPATGIPMIWERDNEIYLETGKTVRTGDKIPASETNAGENQMFMAGKSSLPDIYGGLRNGFSYKEVTLNVMITYAGGHYFLDQQLRDMTTVKTGVWNLHKDLMAESWQEPGDNAKYAEIIYDGGFYYDNEGNPTADFNETAVMTSQYLKPADNIQLKEISLSYNFRSLASKLNLGSMSAYFNVNNVAYWAKAGKFMDPDVMIGKSLNGYIRYGQLMTRTYSMGLKLIF